MLATIDRRPGRRVFAWERLLLALEGAMLVVIVTISVYNRFIHSDTALHHAFEAAGVGLDEAAAHFIGSMQRTTVWPIHYMTSIFLSLLWVWHGSLFSGIGGGFRYMALMVAAGVSAMAGVVIFMVEFPAFSWIHYIASVVASASYLNILATRIAR